MRGQPSLQGPRDRDQLKQEEQSLALQPHLVLLLLSWSLEEEDKSQFLMHHPVLCPLSTILEQEEEDKSLKFVLFPQGSVHSCVSILCVH